MKLRILSLSILALLTACNDSSESPVSESTFAPEVAPVTATVPVKLALTPDEMEAAAYDAVAPQDTVIHETTYYDTTMNGSVALADVNEAASAKRHTMTINGKTVRFTARAGHLVTYGSVGKDPAVKSPEAAIFYTAYTRDDLPRDKRPVTFFWNGGPGSASIWLHMGSWGPKRLKSDAPNIPASAYTKQPESFPFIDNEITLLDHSDLVFVDPPGAGYSTAVFPHTNRDFWGTDIDAKVFADFIIRYNNVNNRQSSPKYLYGESYGGIRTPIVANLLEAAGTSRFDADPSGKPPVVLSGYILNSPVLDYGSDCDNKGDDVREFCAGYIPSYAMTADYFKKSTTRGGASQAEYLQTLKQYMKATYIPVFQPMLDRYYKVHNKWAFSMKDWNAFIKTLPGQEFLRDIAAKTGISSIYWGKYPDFVPRSLRENLVSGFRLGRFDARMKVPADEDGDSKYYEADDYIDVAFINQMKTYLPDFVNYHSALDYKLSSEPGDDWVWKRASQISNNPVSLPDIQSALTYDPKLKLLILHGYEDIATPGYQTELDLEGVGLGERVPVLWFEGGHMTYNTEESRPLLKRALDEYFEGAPYNPQTALTARTTQQFKITSAPQLTPAAAAN